MEEKGDNDLLGTLACAEHNFTLSAVFQLWLGWVPLAQLPRTLRSAELI